MMSAIPAGMDVELTYQLIDSYVLDCERAATVPEIDRLQLSAAMDFCRRLRRTAPACGYQPRGIHLYVLHPQSCEHPFEP